MVWICASASAPAMRAAGLERHLVVAVERIQRGQRQVAGVGELAIDVQIRGRADVDDGREADRRFVGAACRTGETAGVAVHIVGTVRERRMFEIVLRDTDDRQRGDDAVDFGVDVRSDVVGRVGAGAGQQADCRGDDLGVDRRGMHRTDIERAVDAAAGDVDVGAGADRRIGRGVVVGGGRHGIAGDDAAAAGDAFGEIVVVLHGVHLHRTGGDPRVVADRSLVGAVRCSGRVCCAGGDQTHGDVGAFGELLIVAEAGDDQRAGKVDDG